MRFKVLVFAALIAASSGAAGAPEADPRGVEAGPFVQPVAFRFPECATPALLAETPEGPVARCAEGRAFRLEGATLREMDAPFVAADSNGAAPPATPPGFEIRQIIEGKDVPYWAATNDGVLGLDEAGAILKHIKAERRSLPWGDALSIAQDSEGRLIVGTAEGMAYQKSKGGWRWYAGKRYLPGNRVEGLFVDGPRVWAATDGGLALIDFQTWTLAQKAAYLENMTQTRHNREGLVGPCLLDDAEDLSSWKPMDDDNDGLWTSMYIAAESYRYAATGDPEARRNARTSLEALMKLESVTGLPGFPARSFVPLDWKMNERWHPSPDGVHQWKDDTSSDEIVGHYYGYSVYYDFAADEDEKKEIREVVGRITDRIVDNGYMLTDLDGEPTFWGRWAPEFFKSDETGFSVRRINSLEILSHLMTAYHITGNRKYLDHYRHLADDEGYVKNMARQRFTIAGFVNHSADELAFLSYYPLLKYAKEYDSNSDHVAAYLDSLNFTWKQERPERNPLWAYIVCASMGKHGQCDADVALDTLREMPIDRRAWKVKNSERKDLRASAFRDRFGSLQATEVVPHAESCACKWNYNPYEFDDEGNGRYEESATPFLLPYWMGREYGFLIEAEGK